MDIGNYKEEREHVGQVNDHLLITTRPKSTNGKIFLGYFLCTKYMKPCTEKLFSKHSAQFSFWC